MKNIVIAIAAGLTASFVHAYDLTVSAGPQNQIVSGSESYTLDQGTKSVVLLYNVYSAEYPYYVNAQSVFNDVWSLSVLGGNGVFYSITRQVNSQLTQPPTWLPDSTTGDIREVIDVSGITSSSSATFQVRGTAMNVGDSILPTIVRASLELPPKLTITAASSDTITANNGGIYYSIPSVGNVNTLQRYFTLDISKSKAVELTDITVTLQGDGGVDLMNAVDHMPIPSNNDVQVINETSTDLTLRVRVTIATPVSSVNSIPPPASNLAYEFHVRGQDSNGQSISTTRTVTGRRGLWRMASVLPSRYGSRDPGFDDWGARGTYHWLQKNSALINAVDDISGEHGRNIGHSTHQYGTDIDTYHFYRFAGATSGTDNYNKLRTAVVDAFGMLQANGNPDPNPPAVAQAAFAQLVAYVGATRSGLRKLANLGTVSRLYYAIGSASGMLPNGWARSLIETGSVARTVNGVTQTLDLGVGAWNEAKVAYNSVHNNHVHITLNRIAINEE